MFSCPPSALRDPALGPHRQLLHHRDHPEEPAAPPPTHQPVPAQHVHLRLPQPDDQPDPLPHEGGRHLPDVLPGTIPLQNHAALYG